MANKTTKKSETKKEKYVYGVELKRLLETEDDEEICDAYFEEDSATIEFDEFHEKFEVLVNARDPETNELIYPKMKAISGINLNWFWSALSEEIFNALPANCNLNLENIFADLEDTLSQNQDEVSRAKAYSKEKTPTAFMFEITDIICDKILNRGIRYLLEKNNVDGI